MATGSLEGVEAELVASMVQTDAQPEDGLPFRVALPGDWSGRANSGLFASSEELSSWRPRLVDRDNLDQVMAGLGVKLQLPPLDHQGQPIVINFDRLDDFHPDRLFERLEIFESLRQTRAQLSNPKTFSEAAAEVRNWEGVLLPISPNSSTKIAEPDVDESPRPASPTAVTGGSLLDQILDNSPAASPAHAKDASPADAVSHEISELARVAVQPFLSPNIDADQEQMIAAVDERIAVQLRAIMHHPDFQALESAWRALDFLVMRLETGTELKLYLLDISFNEMKADLNAESDVRSTAFYKLLVEQTVETPGGLPWSVIAANYSFDLTGADTELIERWSTIAQASRAPFIATTSAHLLGCRSLAQTPDLDDWRDAIHPKTEERWQRLRALPGAEYVGLALPRFLLRLPYGKDTDETEQLEFEELVQDGDDSNAHESYLWANPAFAVAFLLSKGFSEDGWSFRPSDFLDIEGLPMYVYEIDGESQMKPCAEVLLTLRAAEQIIDRGFMPLLSMKNSETVRLGMMQSISGKRLAGPWAR